MTLNFGIDERGTLSYVQMGEEVGPDGDLC